MKKEIIATAVRQVSNDAGTIELFDLYKNDGSHSCQPVLCFLKSHSKIDDNLDVWKNEDDIWDNSEYVYNFLKGLNKNKKSATKELQKFCKKNGYSYENTKEDLIRIYITSKSLKFWEKFKKH